MYKQYNNADGSINTNAIIRTTDGSCIPFDPANTDYANFKREIAAGTAELQDAEGQSMSAADANAFVTTLP